MPDTGTPWGNGSAPHGLTDADALQTAKAWSLDLLSVDTPGALSRFAAQVAAHQRQASAKAAPGRFQLLTRADLDNLPPLEWVAEGRIPAGALCALIGLPGHYKSILALDLACCVAEGLPWLGCRATPGYVVYVLAEGADELRPRLRAWEQEHGREIGPRLLAMAEPLPLMESASVAAFLAQLATLPEPPRLVVLDTLSWCIAGAEENSARDMSVAMESGRKIIQATGASVLLVHHTTKAGTDARGSSALLGAVRSEHVCTLTDGALKVEHTKLNAGARAPLVVLSPSACGPSIVLRPVAPFSRLERDADLTPHRRAILETLHQIAPVEGIAPTAWIKSCKAAESSFYAARKWLLDKGFVGQMGTVSRPRYFVTMDGNRALLQSNSNSLLQSGDYSTPSGCVLEDTPSGVTAPSAQKEC